MTCPEVPVVVRDSTGSQIAHYYPQSHTLTVRSSTGDVLFSAQHPCLALSFLPQSFPSTLLLVNESNEFSLLNITDPTQFDSNFLKVASFDSHLKVSTFPPNVIFAFVSNTIIHVYELLLPLRCLPVRRYRIPESICWFDFTDAESLVCVSGDESQLKLRWFSLSKIHEIKALTIKLENGVNFLDAAVSPADPTRIAILLSDGHAEVYSGRNRIGKTGSTPGEVNGAKEIDWSFFGTAIEIVDGENQVRRFLEIVPDNWEEGNEFD
jgi:hypothetical protein